MTYREAFVAAVARLTSAPHPTETPELDARVLLGHVAGLSHASLLARWNESADTVWEQFEQALVRRVDGEPVAWITGTKEFLGMEFETSVGLLVPRADTEILVEAALELVNASPGVPARVVDICTGTGCVAVSLAALSAAPIEVWGGDIAPLAVATAARNAERLLPSGRSVTVVESDLLTALPGPWSLIVSNPPYLTTAETRERVDDLGWKEPALALDGGIDGLDIPRRLITQAAERLLGGGWLLLEAAGAQMPALTDCLEQHRFREVRTWRDLAGIERVIGGRVP
jgi:release factor glutamine methyltransferase